ncbi:MAG: hypothetical protein WB615_15390 [Candidatus Tumulicola sp.]
MTVRNALPSVGPVLFIIAALAGAGCTHKTDAARELGSAVAPFSRARDQTVALVTAAKHALGAADLNSLAVTYAALEEKGNGYAGFLVEAVNAGSFDSDVNAKDAQKLTDAVKAFNKSFASLAPASLAGTSVPSAWIPQFSQSMEAYWNHYHEQLAALSPQAKLDLIKQLKARVVWPNYENIATESIAQPTPH